MIVEKKNQRVTARREAIISAAEEVFNAKGYTAATVDEIAVRANISKGSIYNYFQSKQEIFGQLFRKEVQEEESRVEELLQRSIPAREKFTMFLEQCFQRLTKYEHIGRLLLEFWATAASDAGNGTFSLTYRDLYTRVQQQVQEMFEQGAAEGDFVLEFGADVSAALLIAAIDGMHVQVLLGARPHWTPTEFSAFQQAVTDALVAGKHRKDPAGA